ncbi:hypothetical protein LCGC14_2875060 [marine sediment metagenome]|uniref:Uncharacterized protein n=1 Tax=marine sediment metagenome TaxID=412755 RepID=A0A0F8Y1R1_9ZZZZ
MAVRNFRKVKTAKMAAAKARKRGLKATVFKKKKGVVGVSVTRKK